METYIVRQPILNDKQTVVAYELLYKENGINATPDRQEAWVASAVEELLGKANDENFLDDKIAFVTFTPNLLMKNIPRMFPEKSLVIQIGDDSIVHPVAQKMIYRFKKQGYRIALKDFEFMPRFFGIMDAVDILKVDFRKPESSLRNIVSVAHSFDKEVAAYAAREEGLLKMDSLAEDTVRFPDPLLRQAAHLVAEVSGADRVRKVLYNYILAGGIQSPQKLLNGIIIAEGMVAIGEGEDLDYIFTYLIPSYFGIDYHETVHEIYLRYKKERFANRSAKDES